MDKAVAEFEKRHRAVTARHRRLAEGYVTALNRNGTIEHKPIRRIPFFRARTVVLTLAVFFCFKAYLLFALGAEGYESHLAQLASGTTAEKAGAWAMAIDPASLWLSEKIQLVLN